MRKIILLVCACAFFSFCSKKGGDPIDHNQALRMTINGSVVNYDNFWFYDQQPNTNQYNCYFRSFCPLDSLGQPDSFCILSYSATCLTTDRKFHFLFEYKVRENKSKLMSYLANTVHIEDSIVTPLFTNQNVSFANNQDSLGISIWVNDIPNQKLYFSNLYPHGQINQDPRFYFNFENESFVYNYSYPGTGYDGCRAISARGIFATVVYSDNGDSIVIENGVFRLTYCE